MLEQAIPYILMVVGIAGFELAGRRVWWAWYVNIANQALWLFFALLTGYWGFVVGTIFYTYQFSRNAIKWTKERHELNKPADEYVAMGRVEHISLQFNGPAQIQIGSIGMYEANCPNVGITAYYKRGELPYASHVPEYLGAPCGNINTESRFACVRPAGHKDRHGYAGMFWSDKDGEYTDQFRGRIVRNDANLESRG